MQKISTSCLCFEILSMNLSFLLISYEKLLFKKKKTIQSLFVVQLYLKSPSKMYQCYS